MVLRSGTWAWSLRPASDGALVIYRNVHRAADELHAWIGDDALVTDDTIVLHARTPHRRIWTDVIGVRWEVSVARRWKVGQGSHSSALIFDRGGAQWTVEVPAESELGELTHGELLALLEQTGNR